METDMTQEEKQLLLKDICARLPYGVKVGIRDGYYPYVVQAVYSDLDVLVRDIHRYSLLGECNLYLRSMSSITEEEREVLNNLIYNRDSIWISPVPVWVINESNIEEYIDFCNSHHLDWRDLIGKGLALEAPEGMYK